MRHLQSAVENAGTTEDDIVAVQFYRFGNIFGGFGGGRSAKATGARGEDLQVQITISFEEAVFGVKKDITLSRVESCSHCHGTGAKNGTEYTTCSECHGSGRVRYTENSFFGI